MTEEGIVYLDGVKLFLLLTSLFVSMFLIALDRLIISTAIPEITNEFKSVTDIGWYGSAYLLTNCAFQLLFGKLYTFFSIKGTFLVSIVLFEIGSAICGAAPSSISFIIGRAIAGLGAAGIMAGVIVIIVYSIPLAKRPLYQGLFGAIFGVSSIIGPLIGGAFTSKVSWRWCFYINLPIGAVAIVVVVWVLHVPDRDTTKGTLREKIMQLDLLGTSALVPGTVCLLLALQWGGSTYAWGEWRIILLLVLASVLLVAFVLVQIFLPETATIPGHIFMQRSILAGVWVTICVGSSMMVYIYFIPIWFQAIRGVSALDSGILLLPLCLPMVVSSIICGVLTTKIGYYTPFLIIGAVFMSIGAGLLTTWEVDTPLSKQIGYQFIYSWGLGLSFQAPNLAAQTVLPTRDVPVGSTLMFFTQLLGGAIFISVGQNVLNNQLLQQLGHVEGFDLRVLDSHGATSIIQALPEAMRNEVLRGYNEALRKVFLVGLIMTALMVFGAVGMEWKSVKTKGQVKGAEPEEGKVAKEKGEGSEKGSVKEGVVEAKGVESGDDRRSQEKVDEAERKEGGEARDEATTVAGEKEKEAKMA
ncbi:major facilitator superfamily domain-containing protein [Schizothecium vesticola]|uniref:Major facilitator superfamily domain-containing protein n=1 Tax=Schizothecium vesticola TaxID=314040 RepID=A0AA40F693_9PEZI|nr:major facilitator superfamily domain-containing protein [Schizothecium vesticola]